MIKKHFIPHKNNEYRPYILRRKAVFIFLKIILVIEILFLIQVLLIIPYTDLFSSILPDVLVDLTNANRKSNHIPLVKPNSLLEQAAKLKAEDMAEKGYFSHTTPEGKTPWEWLYEVGYHFKSAGENLAVNFSDSKVLDRAWMNSEGHRANILNEKFTEIGIATAKGMYKGKEAVFVVQFFGLPAKASVETQTRTQANQAPTTPIETKIQQEAAEEKQIVIVLGDVEEESQGIPVSSIINPESSLLERAFAMPREVTNAVYIFIAALVLLAVLLKIVVKITIQHPKLIFNGVVVLFIIISVLYLNCLITEQGIIF